MKNITDVIVAELDRITRMLETETETFSLSERKEPDQQRMMEISAVTNAIYKGIGRLSCIVTLIPFITQEQKLAVIDATSRYERAADSAVQTLRESDEEFKDTFDAMASLAKKKNPDAKFPGSGLLGR